MQHQTLEAVRRQEMGRDTDSLRAVGSIPAVMYGFGTEPTNLTLDRNAFVKVYASAGESSVIDLMVDGVTHPVIITEIQRHPLTDFFSHADFRRVDRTRKMEAKIPLVLTGESPAVKALGGTLIQALEEIEVLSLPDALVPEILVDVSHLATFEDVIRVKDIALPAGCELKTDLEMTVVIVEAPRSDEEMAALDAAVDTDVTKVEVLTEKKEDLEAAAAAEGDKK